MAQYTVRAGDKPYTVSDEEVATLIDWVACYGYMLMKPNGYLFLTGLVEKDERQRVADEIRTKLFQAARRAYPGNVLVSY